MTVTSPPAKVLRLLVLPTDDGARLDVFLAAATGLGRRAARRLIASGRVLRNRAPVRVQSRTLSLADVVEIPAEAQGAGSVARPAVPRPTILYEDRLLLAADKPSGILSQAAGGTGPRDLALDQMLLLALAARDGRRPYLRLLHRLDRLTSGVVLCAASPEAHRPLARAWATGAVDRRYLAVVVGTPSSSEIAIDRPIARDRGHAWRFAESPEGRPSRTDVRVLAAGPGGTTIVECRLRTGRTHQVRVHLSALGHPVAGDRLYGSPPTEGAQRPLLHAVSLAIPHPEDGRRLEVSSPLPEDLARFLGPVAGSVVSALHRG